MDRGEIYLVNLNPTAGKEERGQNRPVLVITKKAFNEVSGTPFVVPITNGGAGFTWKNLTVPLAEAGTITQGVIITSQVRAIDLTDRGATYVEKLPESILDEVVAKVQAYLA